MCGIAGVFHRDGRPVDREILVRMRTHGRHYLAQYRGWVNQYLESNLEQQRAIDLSTLNAPQLLIHIYRWIDHLRRISCCHFVTAARLGFYFAESIRFHLTEQLGEGAGALIPQLLQALPKPVSAVMTSRQESKRS